MLMCSECNDTGWPVEIVRSLGSGRRPSAPCSSCRSEENKLWRQMQEIRSGFEPDRILYDREPLQVRLQILRNLIAQLSPKQTPQVKKGQTWKGPR